MVRRRYFLCFLAFMWALPSQLIDAAKCAALDTKFMVASDTTHAKPDGKALEIDDLAMEISVWYEKFFGKCMLSYHLDDPMPIKHFRGCNKTKQRNSTVTFPPNHCITLKVLLLPATTGSAIRRLNESIRALRPSNSTKIHIRNVYWDEEEVMHRDNKKSIPYSTFLNSFPEFLFPWIVDKKLAKSEDTAVTGVPPFAESSSDGADALAEIRKVLDLTNDTAETDAGLTNQTSDFSNETTRARNETLVNGTNTVPINETKAPVALPSAVKKEESSSSGATVFYTLLGLSLSFLAVVSLIYVCRRKSGPRVTTQLTPHNLSTREIRRMSYTYDEGPEWAPVGDY